LDRAYDLDLRINTNVETLKNIEDKERKDEKDTTKNEQERA
jgi:hypothetical protein